MRLTDWYVCLCCPDSITQKWKKPEEARNQTTPIKNMITGSKRETLYPTTSRCASTNRHVTDIREPCLINRQGHPSPESSPIRTDKTRPNVTCLCNTYTCVYYVHQLWVESWLARASSWTDYTDDAVKTKTARSARRITVKVRWRPTCDRNQNTALVR